MKQFILFIIFSFLLPYYEAIVSGILTDPIDKIKLVIDPNDDPDIHRNVSVLISSKGYPVEEHIVNTEDGYILSVQRVPHGRKSNFNGGKKDVVLLVHGLLADASSWFLNFPGQSLGYDLPDAGYDAWFLNTRGCTYSRKHATLKTDEYKFWDFSFNEVGQYDIPATIDYILKVTGEEKVFLIGHSQGTTSSFSMLADIPDINNKVRLFIAMAPVTYVGYITSPIRYLAPVQNPPIFIVNLVTSGEFLRNTELLIVFQETLCVAVTSELCENLIFALFGEDKAQLNETRLAVYVSHFPSGSSTKSIAHYGQLVMSKKFRKYDYGINGNLMKYHQEKPPNYDLCNITAPVALIWSTNDKLADPRDVDLLRKQLKSLIFDYQVPYQYNHADFVIAKNTHEFINAPVVKLMAEH